MKRRPALSLATTLTFAVLLVALAVAPSRAQTVDPAARGLDLFADVPDGAPAGGTVTIALGTFGFTSATAAKPLGNVTVDAAWTGERDGKPVTVVSDADGLAKLTLNLPDGPAESASLVLALRFGEHRRTRTVSVVREAPFELSLSVPSDRVSPGGSTTAWVRLLDRRTDRPVANKSIAIHLQEGGVNVTTRTVVTDASGSAMTAMPIPKIERAAFRWRLSASAVDVRASAAVAELFATEATPARASIVATAPAAKVRLGAPAVFRVRLANAAGEPLSDAPVHVLFLRDGEVAPSGELPNGKSRFKENARLLKTDVAGVVEVPYEAPPTIIRSQTVRLAASATLDGRDQMTESGELTIETRGTGNLDLTAEDASLIPGVEQALYVHVRDGFGDPVTTGFKLEGDGLSVDGATDALGWASVSWKVPRDVGTARERGPCSGSVAASVKVTLSEKAPKELRAGGPMIQCMAVERANRVLVRPSSRTPRVGEPLALEVLVTNGQGEGSRLGPVAVQVGSTPSWLTERDALSADVTRFRGTVTVPPGLGGVLPVRAVVLRDGAPSLLGIASVLQKPATIPTLTASVVGGRTVPSGIVSVEAKLADEQGKPLVGSVAAMVVDAASGDYDDAFTSFDTRRRLCALVSASEKQCDAALAGRLGTTVAEQLARSSRTPKAPDLDPGRTATSEMTDSFKTMLKSLEGGVFEASSGPERTRDVLRITASGRAFNPELFTVVTQAMSQPPLTPGGEPMALADLVSVDPQVNFDNVARRVSRLKLFRLLVLARAFRHDNNLDADEPALKDPSALLRRWKQQGNDAMLYDAWGNAFAFAASKGKAARPFLSPIPGFDLVSPGPDGKLGTSDDIADPFARVVKAGSPYALAMGEDRIADAWLDMRVADASITSWTAVMDKHTGTQLGDEQGSGEGHGRLGGSHRSKPPSIRMGATSVTRPELHYVWQTPVRTDAQGVARFDVPLGGDETTYRVIVLGMPDDAGTAVGSTDVRAVLPLSVRTAVGDRVTQGDELDAVVTVVNRTKASLVAELSLAVGGGGRLAKGEAAKRQLSIAAGGKQRVVARVVADGEGKLQIRASVSGGGNHDDSMHEIAIDPPGKVLVLARSRFVVSSTTIPGFAADARTSFLDRPRLLVESGPQASLEALLGERLIEDASTRSEAAEVIEIYDRVRRYAEGMGKPGEALSDRAKLLGQRATGRYLALEAPGSDPQRDAAVTRRAMRASPIANSIAETSELCPAEGTPSDAALWDLAESEPAPVAGRVETCWDATIQAAMTRASSTRDAVAIARLVLAFAERDHRRSLASELAGILAREAKLVPSGAITLAAARGKEATVIVYAALVRARGAGWISVAPADILLGWLEVQRDASGRYGTARAARAALQALLSAKPLTAPRNLRATALDASGEPIGPTRTLKLDSKGVASESFAAEAKSIRVETDAPVLVRLERTTLKKYRFEASQQATSAPVTLSLRYPRGVTAGETGTLEVAVRAGPGARRSFLVRIPLPPGTTVAEPLPGTDAIPGMVLLRVDTDDAGIAVPSLIPLRFSLGGAFLAPPAEIVDVDDRSVAETSLAQRIEVSRK